MFCRRSAQQHPVCLLVTTPGIHCIGPGRFLTDWYPKHPHQASVAINGNVVDFKNSAFEADAEFMLTPATPGAIVIEGQYDSVMCNRQ